MNWNLLAVFVVILGVIIASNLWLRRRNEASQEPPEGPDSRG